MVFALKEWPVGMTVRAVYIEYVVIRFMKMVGLLQSAYVSCIVSCTKKVTIGNETQFGRKRVICAWS